MPIGSGRNNGAKPVEPPVLPTGLRHAGDDYRPPSSGGTQDFLRSYQQAVNIRARIWRGIAWLLGLAMLYVFLEVVRHG